MKKIEEKRCSEQVYHPQGWGRYIQCQKKATLERNGKPYCKIHDPEYVEAKRKKQEAEWEAEWAQKKARQELGSTAIRACKDINPDNPIAVAQSIEDLYEALKQIRDEGARTISDQTHKYNVDWVDKIAREALAKAEEK